MSNSPRFYIIGTKYGGSEDVLPFMLDEGVISTGFAGDLDLTPVIGNDFTTALSWIDAQIPDESGFAKRTLARFAGMSPGDVVALKSHSAPSGKKPRLVIARYAVVAGSETAIYRQSNLLGHTLRVDFLDEQEPIELELGGYGHTLHHIEDENRIDLIFGQYADSARLFFKEQATKDKATHSSEVAARGAYLMRRTHNVLQNQLRKILVAHYGESAVKQEENFVDLMVQLQHTTLLFEVKSSPSPVACIREAFGQLLQYSWKLGLAGRSVRYVIVGPSLLADEDRRYLAHIVSEASIPLAYCTPATFEPSDV